MVNVKGRALMKKLVFTWAWIDLQCFLFVFQDRGLWVQESDEECEVHKGHVTYALCFGLDVSGAPVLADHNSVDFCSGSVCYV